MPTNKILIVGNGSMGQRRQGILKEMGMKITTYDPDLNTGATISNLIEAIDVSKYDALFICSPPVNHQAWVMDAVLNDVPVFVEKPFCLPAEVVGLRQIVDQAKKPVMVGHNLLWHEGFLAFKESVKGLGPLVYYRAEYGNRLENWVRENKDAYSKYRAQGGGVLLDCLQDIDMALEMQPGLEPRSYHQQVGPPHTVDSEYIASVMAVGPQGSAVLLSFDYVSNIRVRSHVAQGHESGIIWNEDRGPELDASYVAETEAFIKWCDTGRKPKGVPDPFRALDFVRQVYAL